MSKSHLIYARSIFLLMLLATPVLANDTQQLYESNCVSCHAAMTGGDGSTLYARDDRLVRSEESLRQRVEYCESGLGLDWTNEQVRLVSEYLNSKFYHFN